MGQTALAMAYCTVIVQSRLVTLDRRIEEAAAHFGAKPWQVFTT
jgi:putrescine transport system permease protein